ncbi:MAG: TraB/GumN family protein [Paracoccaceae bacterium]
MNRLFPTLLALCMLFPITAFASCGGYDLRQDLSAQQRVELNAAIDQTPYARGNHWIARRNGTVLHLIGTLHLNEPRMEALATRLAPVLETASALYLEINQTDMEAFETGLADDPSPIMITAGPTLIDLLDPDDWETLSYLLEQRGIPSWIAAKLQPWFLTLTLGLPPCLAQMPDADFGLDKRLGDLADARGIPQYSLETVDDVIAIFYRHSIQEQARSLAQMIPMVQAGADQVTTMANAYFEEEHAQILEWARLYTLKITEMTPAEYDAEWGGIETALLEERNKNWMRVLPDLRDQTVVIAVGAAHLSGDYGLLKLLEQDGYSLERAPF